jgi:hypothetical protein
MILPGHLLEHKIARVLLWRISRFPMAVIVFGALSARYSAIEEG